MLYDFALYKYSNSNLLQTYKVVSNIYIWKYVKVIKCKGDTCRRLPKSPDQAATRDDNACTPTHTPTKQPKKVLILLPSLPGDLTEGNFLTV